MKKLSEHIKDNTKDRWWKPVEESFAGLNVSGIKVICPHCKELGLVVTRWVKGTVIKPIYVLHIKWRKLRNICKLDSLQADNIRAKVKVLDSDIKNLMSSRRSFILFSGGLDSLCTLFYLRNLAKNINHSLTAIFVDTTAGLPANTKYVKKVCRYLDLKLKIVKPKVDYFTLVKKWGIPSFKYRWCCRELKIKPIQEYLKKIKEPKVVFDGIRAAESYVRKQYIPIWYHPSFKCLSVSPIFYWRDDQVSEYVHSNGIPKTILHSMGTSTECWCGAYKTQSDFEKLYSLDKGMFRKLVEVESKNKSGYTFLYKDGRRIPLKELEKKLKRENTTRK